MGSLVTTPRPAGLIRRLSFAVAMLLALLTVAGSAQAAALTPAASHWCRAGDPPLHASSQTPCALAAGVVNNLFNSPALTPGSTRTISVSEPATRTAYRVRLVCRGDHVIATGPNGIWIRFYYAG